MIEFKKMFQEIEELEALIRKAELINDNHAEFAKRMFQYCIDSRYERMGPFVSRTVH